MNGTPVKEPEVAGNLVFMPQLGAPITDPATRKHVRQQVMQHVGRQRRKAGLNRRQQILKYPLNVPDVTMVGPSTENEGGASQSDKRPLPDLLLNSCCHLAAKRAVERAKFSFDRLGVGLLDPFAKYPFELDDRARKLMSAVYGANSGLVSPFTVVAFRVIWVEVSIIDAAAFHQFLAGAQAYFDFLQTRNTERPSIQVVFHRACSLHLVNTRLANAEIASSDGVIASLILLARYYQMIGDFEKWRMHMLGLKQIINLRGDINTIGMNELLRYMISNIDISGSFALDSPPVFPMPAKPPPPKLRPDTLDPLAKYFIAVWRFGLPEHIQLIDIIYCVAVENLHFQEEIALSNGTLWTETMYICYYINPLLHQLLWLPEVDQSLLSSMIAEALRIGTIIYLGAVRYAFGIRPFQSNTYVKKIKALYNRLENIGVEQTAQNFREGLGWGWVKMWILGCGAINKQAGLDSQWFIDKLHSEMSKLGLQNYADFENHVGSFLWISEVHGVLLRGLDSTSET